MALWGGFSQPLVGFGLGMLAGGIGLWSGLKKAISGYTAPQWQPGTRYTVGRGCEPAGAETGPERLRRMVESNLQAYPSGHQVVVLSGHGTDRQVANLAWTEVGQQMEGLRVESTVIDACSAARLEILPHLTPWSTTVYCSPHKVPTHGFSFEHLLQPKLLGQPDPEGWLGELAQDTYSISAIDGQAFNTRMLPALDRLGRHLSHNLEPARAALGRTPPLGRFSSRRALRHFLEALAQQGIDIDEASQALAATVVATKNDFSFSFDLKDTAHLPRGWRDFVKAVTR